jgi:hypothetical protein
MNHILVSLWEFTIDLIEKHLMTSANMELCRGLILENRLDPVMRLAPA